MSTMSVSCHRFRLDRPPKEDRLMPSLVPGLDTFVGAELDRLREELKIAIAESPYSLEQVATLAGVARTTLRAMLVGEAASQADTLIRAGFVVGVKLALAPLIVKAESDDETTESEADDAPFRIELSDQISSRSQDSKGTAGSSSENLIQESRRPRKKTSSKQGKKSARRKNRTSWCDRPARDVRVHGSTQWSAARSTPTRTVHGNPPRPCSFGSVGRSMCTSWGSGFGSRTGWSVRHSRGEFVFVPRAA